MRTSVQQLLSKVEEDKRRQREKELVKKMRPKLSDDQRTADGAHPIETVGQLADWHVQRIEQAQREDAVDRPPQPQPSGKAKEADREEKKDEADERDEEEEDSAQERLASQLESMLGKLRERISDVDAQIGERLHLLHPSDPSGLVDDSDLADAIMRLQKVDASRVQRLLRPLRSWPGNAERARASGRGGEDARAEVRLTDDEEMELSVHDLKELAEAIKEESDARGHAQRSSKQDAQRWHHSQRCLSASHIRPTSPKRRMRSSPNPVQGLVSLSCTALLDVRGAGSVRATQSVPQWDGRTCRRLGGSRSCHPTGERGLHPVLRKTGLSRAAARLDKNPSSRGSARAWSCMHVS